MSCSTCDGYKLVTVNDDKLEPCPDCSVGEHTVTCPVHGQLVITFNGRLAGKCWGCVQEAAAAMTWLRDHRRAA